MSIFQIGFFTIKYWTLFLFLLDIYLILKKNNEKKTAHIFRQRQYHTRKSFCTLKFMTLKFERSKFFKNLKFFLSISMCFLLLSFNFTTKFSILYSLKFNIFTFYFLNIGGKLIFHTFTIFYIRVRRQGDNVIYINKHSVSVSND